MAHQTAVVEASKDREYFGLFMEQGTGKTFCTIATATHLYLTGKIDTVIVLAPNGVHDNWAINELPTHLREDIKAVSSIAVWHSTDGAKARNRFLHTLQVRDEKSLLWVFANIEALRVGAFTTALNGAAFSWKNALLVIDESTIIKNPKAQVTKAAIALGDACAYRRILSGTPMSQGPLDLWGQCRFLSPDALPYKSWTAFKYQFAIEEVINLGPNRPSFVKITGYRNQGELAQLIKRFSHRILKSECLDLPEKVYETRYVELTPEQRRAYTNLVEKAFSSLPNEGIVTVTSAIALILRLQQVALGYAPDETATLIPIPSNRLDTLADVMNESTGKGIIFCRFHEDVRRVMDLLRERAERAVEYSGAVSEIYRVSAVDMFQNDPEVRWFVATSAAARGLTLTAAETVIYYSQDYRLETRLQSEDRAHRIGQKKTVTYVDLVARKTVDEQIISALRKKKNLAEEIIDAKVLKRMLELG